MSSRSRAAFALVVAPLIMSCGERSAGDASTQELSGANPPVRTGNGADVSEQPFADSSLAFVDRVAVFVEATEDEIEQVRSEHTEDDFAVIADDLMYYRATAQEYLEARGVPVVRVARRWSLSFNVAGRLQQFDFSREPTLDLIVLYEPGRDPEAIAPADIHQANEYFGFTKTR